MPQPAEKCRNNDVAGGQNRKRRRRKKRKKRGGEKRSIEGKASYSPRQLSRMRQAHRKGTVNGFINGASAT